MIFYRKYLYIYFCFPVLKVKVFTFILSNWFSTKLLFELLSFNIFTSFEYNELNILSLINFCVYVITCNLLLFFPLFFYSMKCPYYEINKIFNTFTKKNQNKITMKSQHIRTKLIIPQIQIHSDLSWASCVSQLLFLRLAIVLVLYQFH